MCKIVFLHKTKVLLLDDKKKKVNYGEKWLYLNSWPFLKKVKKKDDEGRVWNWL